MQVKAYLPALLWMVIILIASGYPGNKVLQMPSIWEADKWVHVFIYTLFSIFLLVAYHKQYINKKTRYNLILKVIFFGFFYGGFMEVLQYYIFPNRSGNIYDFLANSLGSLLGVIIYPSIIKLLPINKWLN